LNGANNQKDWQQQKTQRFHITTPSPRFHHLAILVFHPLYFKQNWVNDYGTQLRLVCRCQL